MKKINYKTLVSLMLISILVASCKLPELKKREVRQDIPTSFNTNGDTTNSARLNWKLYFNDPYLAALIDTALSNNQEFNILIQEISRENNEIDAKKGEYLPFINLGIGAGAEKVGRYTSQGASEATTEIEPGKEMPDPVPDFTIGATASWEIDIWHKMRNSRKAQVMKYLSSIEGKNFMQTQLVSEIASAYYELLALDKQKQFILQNIELQNNALEVVKLQKKSAKVTELAVKRFEAQVLKTRSLLYDIDQDIIKTENEINFLLGRYPRKISRDFNAFDNLVPNQVYTGIPSQMLENRPDIKQAELNLVAAKLNVKVAKANFYPSLSLNAGIGLQAFDPSYLLTSSPESMLYSLVGDLSAPLINRKAIKANYKNANAKQIQAVYDYEKTVLKAYLEVVTEMSNINNLEKSYRLREAQVQTLTASINISNDLFKSARADYMEVLLTQRDALESKFELIETKKNQLIASVMIYKFLGGGWQ